MVDGPCYVSFVGGKARKRSDLANTASESHVTSSEMTGDLPPDCLALLIRCFKC